MNKHTGKNLAALWAKMQEVSLKDAECQLNLTQENDKTDSSSTSSQTKSESTDMLSMQIRLQLLEDLTTSQGNQSLIHFNLIFSAQNPLILKITIVMVIYPVMVILQNYRYFMNSISQHVKHFFSRAY